MSWLRSLAFDDTCSRATFIDYLSGVEMLLARRAALWAALEQAIPDRLSRSDDRPAALLSRGRHADRGRARRRDRRHHRVQTSQAARELSRPRAVRTLVGTKRRQGAITKAGSAHARRLLVEAAWHYRRPPRVSEPLKRRQDGQPPAAVDAAWRAQIRLHRRWAHLDAARAKKRTTVAVAVARELACFVWEIARQPD